MSCFGCYLSKFALFCLCVYFNLGVASLFCLCLQLLSVFDVRFIDGLLV